MQFRRNERGPIRLHRNARAILSHRLQTGDGDDSEVRKLALAMGATIEAALPQGLLVRFSAGQRIPLEQPGLRISFLPQPDILTVGQYSINTARPRYRPRVPPQLRVSAVARDSWPHHLAQLIAPPMPEWVRQIEETGVTVVEPISRYGLYLYGSPAVVATLRKRFSFISWTGHFHPAYRIGPGTHVDQGDGQLDISVYPAAAVGEVIAVLQALDVRAIELDVPPYAPGPTYSTVTAFFTSIDNASVEKLAHVPAVRWIEGSLEEAHADGERTVLSTMGVRPVAPGYTAWLNQRGLSGSNVVVAIADSGVDRNKENNEFGHPDLRGRQKAFIPYTNEANSSDRQNHGTLVASIAVGNGSSGQTEGAPPDDFLKGQGVAPEANYVTQNPYLEGGPARLMDRIARDAARAEADILNVSFSYGSPTSVTAGYFSHAAAVDRSVRNPLRSLARPRELTIVSSAGNVGPDDKTIGPPKEAKNLIVVGAGCTRPNDERCRDDLWKGSSRGPASDGRILPTLVAPGTEVWGAAHRSGAVGANTSPRFGKDSGTSYAAPIVTGCCALLTEWWRSRHSDRDPSPAMLKALLINGADPIAAGRTRKRAPGKSFPNNLQGWGVVNLSNVVDAPDHFEPESARGARLAFDQERPMLCPGEQHEFRVRACLPDRPMRITLVWTDAPGDTNNGPTLRNDLDLEVQGCTTGTHYVGNDFLDAFSRPFPPEHAIMPESLHNVECVYVQEPSEPYDVVIRASRLVQNARYPFDSAGWQDYALVIDNAVLIVP